MNTAHILFAIKFYFCKKSGWGLLEIVVLIIAGIAAGFINTLAGGGSAISLSILMMFGLDASIANGTNRYCGNSAEYCRCIEF
jgi:hypothetical protein